MVSVRINGSEAPIRSEGLTRMPELIELVKSWIDPEHMITHLLIEGREFEDADWSSSLGAYETAILEVQTDTPANFVRDRFAQSWGIIQSCLTEFRDSRLSFQEGNTVAGNKKLVKAVQTLQAFFDWYGALMELVPTAGRAAYDLTPQIRELIEVCKHICQQQLYQSWWALGEALEKELEPKLQKMGETCRNFR